MPVTQACPATVGIHPGPVSGSIAGLLGHQDIRQAIEKEVWHLILAESGARAPSCAVSRSAGGENELGSDRW